MSDQPTRVDARFVASFLTRAEPFPGSQLAPAALRTGLVRGGYALPRAVTSPPGYLLEFPSGGTRWRVDAETGEVLTQ